MVPSSAVTGSRTHGESPPSIVFENVSFRYPTSSRAVLWSLSFELQAGVAHALVGENGAGKSTIVKLMAGAYRPTTGRILVDGVDTVAWTAGDLARWQQRFACVLQDIPALPIPIGDYIDLGASVSGEHAGGGERDSRSLDRAAARTRLLPVVERLAEGWETPLSNTMAGGTDLSGGEWQRVALTQAVRAVDDGASVFVLDEPAAALDVESEAELVADYLQLVANTTSLVISHRFSVVRPVHDILVLGDGRIIEPGSHDELMRRHGRYAAMFDAQSTYYVNPEPTMEGD